MEYNDLSYTRFSFFARQQADTTLRVPDPKRPERSEY